jgi:trk system potassium uptake protein TrkA
MKLRLIILGVSTFARSLIEYVSANADAEIIAVDKDEKTVNEIVESVSRALIGDATNMELLKKLGVADADHILVSVASIEASLLAVLHLRNLEAKHTTVEAISEPHRRLLELLQVDEVVFPEKQMAAFFGLRMLHPGFSGARMLVKGSSLVAASVPDELADKSVGTIEKDYEIDIVYVIRNAEERAFKATAEETVMKDDLLVAAGTNERLIEFERALREPGPYGKLVPWW